MVVFKKENYRLIPPAVGGGLSVESPNSSIIRQQREPVFIYQVAPGMSTEAR